MGGGVSLPASLRGDGPCADCGTFENIIWYMDNSDWNEVMDPTDDRYRILCIPCFVVRAAERGRRGAWRLIMPSPSPEYAQ